MYYAAQQHHTNPEVIKMICIFNFTRNCKNLAILVKCLFISIFVFVSVVTEVQSVKSIIKPTHMIKYLIRSFCARYFYVYFCIFKCHIFQA